MSDKKLILVVEDDDDTRAMVCSMLQTLEYDVIDYASGRDMLAEVKDKQIDLAILDIMMPIMDGYEVMSELRKIPQFKELPIIMLTAKNEAHEILEGYSAGADYYITKPFDARQLRYGIEIVMTPEDKN